MRNKNYFLLFIGLLFATISFAQVTVKGTVTDKDDNSPIPGVTVVIQNTTRGTITDIDGKYELQLDSLGQTLEFKFVGMQSVTQIVTTTTVNIGMSAGMELQDVVVTALGISREKKALGYSTQKVDGEDLNNVKYDNIVNSMSGRVAGAQVKQSGNFGGSTNIVLRGATSLIGNNQALFVIDGVPLDNTNSNSSYQAQGGGGYDYGNAVSDLNPDDIESMNVLKGAAATALYGERAANGVIMITTKKGSATGKKGIGVTFNSNYTFGKVDKSTFPKYQTNYGAGYGPYYSGADGSDDAGDGGTKAGFEYYDFDGDGTNDYVVPFTEDASFGEKFDGTEVFQWDALHPASPNYMKKTAWQEAENGGITFFETAQSFTNSLALTGGGDKGSFRISYRNLDQKGILPNSQLERNNISFGSSYKATDKLTVSIDANYVNTAATGRNSTGYSDNIMSMYRQWWQTNVDVGTLKSIYENSDQNITWNPNYSYGQGSTNPIYWDNPYWSRHENYQNDVRNRIYGNVSMNYKITSNLSALVRFTLDSYSETREERRAVGSISAPFGVPSAGEVTPADQASGYGRAERNYSESNVDFILTYNKDLNKDLNLNVMAGTNYRKNQLTEIRSSTNGGLIIPGLYSLSNAPSTLTSERDETKAVSSVYGAATFGYKRYLFLDIAMRNDMSSTLGADNRSYFYPAVSGSFVFSEFTKSKAISFGKVRLNYAQVGKAAPWGVTATTYSIPPSFTSPITSANNTENNPDLKPERTNSIEAGLEMYFWNRRLGGDIAVYQTNSKDQIVRAPVSRASGYSSKWINAGEIENKGIEITINAVVMKKKDFQWDIGLNWARNVNKVKSLASGIDNLELGNFQGGVSINAREGESYGAIQGSDYIYKDGEKVIGTDGYYLITETNDQVIGNITPDWTGGITNSFKYKSWAMSFLIDWQKGGDIFSLDQWYGMGTGLYEETDYTNDLGNPVRNPIDDGGGLILDGVKEDGSANDIRVSGNDYRVNGWSRNPNKGFIYDASYVKLREIAVHYSIPKKTLEKTFIANATISFIASNLWIIHKNLPHADPEAGLGSGNLQGFQSGVLPTTRNFGFNLKLNF